MRATSRRTSPFTGVKGAGADCDAAAALAGADSSIFRTAPCTRGGESTVAAPFSAGAGSPPDGGGDSVTERVRAFAGSDPAIFRTLAGALAPGIVDGADAAFFVAVEAPGFGAAAVAETAFVAGGLTDFDNAAAAAGGVLVAEETAGDAVAFTEDTGATDRVAGFFAAAAGAVDAFNVGVAAFASAQALRFVGVNFLCAAA